MSTSQIQQTGPLIERLKESKLIKQGAEAKVYKLPYLFPAPTICYPSSSSKRKAPIPESSYPASLPLLIKHRFPKQYRHPTLDAALTKSRVQAEARALIRCLKAGVTVPSIRAVDLENGIIGMEWVDGFSVREVLGGGAEGEMEEELREGEVDEVAEEPEGPSPAELIMEQLGLSVADLMSAIGTALAKMHTAQIIHGDLTTSNLMLRPKPNEQPNYELVVIDFGLSSNSHLPENQAVDLYVLERAFASTHPSSEKMYTKILEAYAATIGDKKWKVVGGRLDEVRLRGRKRDMIG